MVDFASRARKSINDLKTKSLIKKQNKKTFVSGYKDKDDYVGYKPVKKSKKILDDAPSYMKATKYTPPGNLDKGYGNIYTPYQGKKVGPNMGKVIDAGRSVPGYKAVNKKNYKIDTPSIHVSKNTPSGENRMDKKKKKSTKNNYDINEGKILK